MNGNRNEWAVAFHPVGDPSYLSKIAYERAINDLNETHDEYTGDTVRRGIYCAPHIETAESVTQPVEMEGKYYIFVFQCRVRPSAIKNERD